MRALQGGADSWGVVEGVELVLHGVYHKPWVMRKVGRRKYQGDEADYPAKVRFGCCTPDVIDCTRYT